MFFMNKNVMIQQQIFKFREMSTKIIKNPCLTGLHLQQYLQTIMNTLKAVAFHEIYMEKQRQQLCKDQFFDYLTAFRDIDTYKHNKLVGFQLKGFLSLEQSGKINVTQEQCQEVLTCINKSLFAVTYEDFLQIALPYNVALRNASLARYNNLQVKVGTMSQIYQIKSNTSKKISRYFLKEIQFYRELLLRKQNFCQKYGGDLYTFSQNICKGKQTKFNFKQLYDLCREHKFYFNKDEYVAIYKRTKAVPHQSPLFYDDLQGINIEIENLSHLLLTTPDKLSIKQKIRVVDGKSFDHLKQPSYRSIKFNSRQMQMKAENQFEKKQKFIQQERLNQIRDQRDIRYKFCYPELQTYTSLQRSQISELNKKWDKQVESMGNTEINIRYQILKNKRYFI